MDLPAASSGSIARALGAYLRAKPASELPARLRRYQNFRSKALSAHRDELIAALEDEGLRARVVEWLDTKPTLPKEEAALLRLATERSDGWIQQLDGQAAKKSTRAKAAPDHKAMLERERERAKKAREETKRIREEAQRTERDLKSEIARLKTDLATEKTRVRALDKGQSAAISNAKQLRAQMERERRKSRAEIAKVKQAGDGDKRELKGAKRELQQKGRQVAKLEDRIGQLMSAKETPVRKQTSKGMRRRLPVPKGRLEDARETLEAWLATPNVHLLIDGYNATMAEGGFGNLELAAQRDRLIAEVGKLARKSGIEASIVFDGSDVVAGPRRGRKPVTVHYSAPDEIADDRLIALLEGMPKDPVVVVTSDRELQNRAKRLGATVATSRQLLSLLR